MTGAATADNDALTGAVHAYLSQAGGSAFAGNPVDMVAAWQGDDHLLWRVACRGRDAVLKLFLDAGQARSRRQYDGHALLSGAGIAPAPLWVDRYPEGLARQVLVYDWVDGAPLAGDDDAGIMQLAECLARVHNAEAGDARRFSPHPLNLEIYWRIEAAGLAQIIAWLPATLALHQTLRVLRDAAQAQVSLVLPLWQSAPPTPIHGDLRLDHALWRDRSLILVDWEMFGLGDPALDTARFLHREASRLGPGASERWLHHYLAAVDARDQAARIDTYRTLLPLQDAAFLLNGLRTHSQAGLAAELAAALPDIGVAVGAALATAAELLEIGPAANPTASISDQVTGLLDRLPALPDA